MGVERIRQQGILYDECTERNIFWSSCIEYLYTEAYGCLNGMVCYMR